MRKRMLVFAMAALLLSAGSQNVFAMWPTIDITNIIANIENGYTLVQQVQATYQNVQNSIKQLEETRKKFEAFDLKSLDAKDPLGSWKKIMTYGNRMMSYAEDMEDVLNKKDLKIGNGSYSLLDLYTSPGTTVGEMGREGFGFVAVDPFEKRLTPQEKAAFHSKYGMSYGRYLRYNTIMEASAMKAAQVTGMTTELQKNMTDDELWLTTSMHMSGDTESVIQQGVIGNAINRMMVSKIAEQSLLLGKLCQLYADEAALSKLEREEAQDRSNDKHLDISKDYVELLNQGMKSDDFMSLEAHRKW